MHVENVYVLLSNKCCQATHGTPIQPPAAAELQQFDSLRQLGSQLAALPSNTHRDAPPVGIGDICEIDQHSLRTAPRQSVNDMQYVFRNSGVLGHWVNPPFVA